MYSQNVDIRVLVNGRSVREYSHKGMTFIESRHGTNYTVRIKNDNGFKIMACLSVDGLDVITGKPAEETNKGYIVDAYNQTEIKGYRISDKDSASFIFLSKGKSYVAETRGTARNSGVIGVRVFKEKIQTVVPTIQVQPYVYVQPAVYPYPVYPWNPWATGGYYYGSGVLSTGVCASGNNNSITYTCNAGGNVAGQGTITNNSSTSCYLSSTNAAGSAPSAAQNMQSSLGKLRGSYNCSPGVSTKVADNSLKAMNCSNAFDEPISYKQFDTGTGWGKKQDDRVKREYFERGDLLTEVVVYYATRSALIDMGLDLDEDPKISHDDEMPQAFNSRYCRPPKNWVG